MDTPQDELKKLHDSVLSMAKSLLFEEQDGSVSPMIVAVNGENEASIVSLIGMDVNDDDDKQHLAEAMPLFFSQNNIVCYAMLTEAWVVDSPSSDGRQPKDREDKKEVVFINMRHRNGVYRVDSYEIIRNWDSGKPSCLILHNNMSGKGQLGGRFGNLFESPTGSKKDVAQFA